jgi:tRNA threonylcarbamoyladenosine biosynthesis protein TsaE
MVATRVSSGVASASEAETRAIAASFARSLVPGSIVLIAGDLGAGKTAFVRGLAEGLGANPDEVTSPTFTLVHEYRGGRLPIVHVDLYRLDAADLDDIGLDPDLAAAGVVAVEWPERLSRAMPGAVRIHIEDLGGDRRVITRHVGHEAHEDHEENRNS